MSQRAWIKPSVLKLIADEAIRNPKEGRLSLYLRAKDLIEGLGERPPSEETTYKLISEARRNPPKFKKAWTMGSLRDYFLPPESIPSVSKVWRYAISTAEEFTIAQAEWVARLYTSVPEIPSLWFWSHQYAHEERLSLAVNQDMDSFLADSNLILTKWQTQTLLRTDFRDRPVRYKAESFLPVDDHGNFIQELLHSNLPTNPWDDSYSNERDRALSDSIRHLPPLHTLGLTEEATMVYLRWFTYLTKGPNWVTLSAEEACNLIVNLREIIKQEQSHRAKPRHAKASQQPPFLVHALANEDSPSFYSKLGPLLQRVGYQHAPKEVNHEGTHSQTKQRQLHRGSQTRKGPKHR